MPSRVVRLGTEHGYRLIHPLEDAHHHLLVELRALGEVGRPTKVVQLKDVGSALCGSAHDLWGLDLREVQGVERRPKAGQ